MIKAIKSLNYKVDVILSDAMRFNFDDAIVIPLVKGY